MCLEHLCPYTAILALLVIQTHGPDSLPVISTLGQQPLLSTAFLTQQTHKHSYLQYLFFVALFLPPHQGSPMWDGSPSAFLLQAALFQPVKIMPNIYCVPGIVLSLYIILLYLPPTTL